jgi:hypothetical protein
MNHVQMGCAPSTGIPELPADLAAAWGVSVEEVRRAKSAVEAEWGALLRPFLDKMDIMIGLVLVYVKQPPQLFVGALDRVGRINMLQGVLTRSPGARDRLVRLAAHAHDDAAPAPPLRFQDGIDAFYAAVPEWEDPTMTWVFFVNSVAGSVVYRGQKFGNCFMHAPDVILHYAVCLHRSVAGTDVIKLKDMVDLTAYMLALFNGALVWKFVYDDIGGDSVEFLRILGGLDAGHCLERQDLLTDDEVVRNLETHGPALIAYFRTFTAFTSCDEGRHSFIGAEVAASTGKHAMALVGHRRDAAGRVRYLVQNWWESMQLFECDLVFLMSRESTLVWVTKPLLELPNDPPMVDGEFAEGVGGGEERCEEERLPFTVCVGQSTSTRRSRLGSRA